MRRYQILIATLFLIGTCHFSNGQARYAVHFIDFNNELNSKFHKDNVDELCTILVDGYLNDKLKAYKFPQLKSFLLAAESQTESSPKRWNQKLPKGYVFYEPFEMMKAEGLTTEISTSMPRQDSRQQSRPVYFLPPAESDTLSKKEFLDQLIIEGFELDSGKLWNKNKRYASGEDVYYETNNYNALLDTVGIIPTDEQCWELRFRGYFPFYSHLDGLNGISIIGYYETHERDSTWYPELLRLRMGGETGILQDVGVTFLFSDVMRYLDSIHQPVLHDNPLGYIGNGYFVFGSSFQSTEKANLVQWLRRKLSSKASLHKKVLVENDIYYKNFLNEKYEYDYIWNLLQKPDNKAIQVYQSDTLVATIPISAIQRFIEREPKSHMVTYSQALGNNMFFGCVTDFPATLQQKRSTSENVKDDHVSPIGEYFYMQKYSIETQKFQRDTILTFLRPVWEVITREFENKNLTLAEPKTSMYSGKYDWSKIETVRAMAKDIKKEFWENLLHDDLSYSDYPYRGSTSTYLHDTLQPIKPDSMKFTVTYKIHFAPTLATPKFEALQISFKNRRSFYNAEYTFIWEEVKRVLIKENTTELKYFIDRIESGEVDFLESKNVYGLFEAGSRNN